MSEDTVFERSGRLVYRGRIDNRVVDFGTIRVSPTTRDLQEVLIALRAGTHDFGSDDSSRRL